MPRGEHNGHVRGCKHPRWNGGRWIHQGGYVAVKVPAGHHLRMVNGYAYEHQIVAEQMLGRELFTGEHVHHRNGKTDDNRPENLEILTAAEHTRKHNLTKPRDELGRFVGELHHNWPRGDA